MNHYDTSSLKGTVIIRFVGGLGNQLFQFAACYTLSKRLGFELVFDKTNYGWRDSREFDIEKFSLPYNIRKSSSLYRTLIRLGTRLGFDPDEPTIPGFAEVIEPHFHFWPGLRETAESCRVTGYWQSEKYFRENANDIARLLDLDLFLSSRTATQAGEIHAAECSVAVHVRRGDYLSETNSAVFVTLPKAYYEHAYARLTKTVFNPTFFVFSDDIDMAQDLLSDWENTRYISGYSAVEDMMLMSICDYHIIANSSFSWWAAWLNKKANKVVFAPTTWFTPNMAKVLRSDDILPEEWIKI